MHCVRSGRQQSPTLQGSCLPILLPAGCYGDLSPESVLALLSAACIQQGLQSLLLQLIENDCYSFHTSPQAGRRIEAKMELCAYLCV